MWILCFLDLSIVILLSERVVRSPSISFAQIYLNDIDVISSNTDEVFRVAVVSASGAVGSRLTYSNIMLFIAACVARIHARSSCRVLRTCELILSVIRTLDKAWSKLRKWVYWRPVSESQLAFCWPFFSYRRQEFCIKGLRFSTSGTARTLIARFPLTSEPWVIDIVISSLSSRQVSFLNSRALRKSVVINVSVRSNLCSSRGIVH